MWNKGDTSADANISLYQGGIDGTLLETKSISIYVGGESNLVVYWEADAAGDQVFTVIVEDVHPKDNDDTNNHAEFTIKVLAKDDSDDGKDKKSDDSPFPSVVIVVMIMGIAAVCVFYNKRNGLP